MVDAPDHDPLLQAAAQDFAEIIDRLLAKGANLSELAWVVYNAAVQPGFQVLVEAVRRSGVLDNDARMEANRRVDEANAKGVPLPIAITYTAANLSDQYPGPIAAWLASPVPRDHLRVMTVNGTHVLTYHLPVGWRVPAVRDPMPN